MLTDSKYDSLACDEESLSKHKGDCTKKLCKCQYKLKVRVMSFQSFLSFSPDCFAIPKYTEIH